VELLLRHGADVNAQDGRDLAPLHLAVSSRLALRSDVVHLLLGYGASVDIRDDRGQSPFQISLSSGLPEITELLRYFRFD
jgi:ankyrin repeat protein